MHVRFAAVILLAASAAVIPSPASAQLPLARLIVAVSAPRAGATVSRTVPFDAQVTIVGALTVRSVEFKVNGVKIAEDFSAPYSIAWDTRTSGNGSRRLTACARDLLGVLYESEVVTVNVLNDTTPPAVTITAPAAAAMVAGDVTVTANASDNVGVVGVRFTLDGVQLGAEDTASPYSVPWNTASASDGSHTLRAVARDAAGNTTTSADVTVTVDNTPPVVSITAPAADSGVSGAVTVSAGASDGSGIAGVQFRLDGSPLGAEDTSAPFSVQWDTAAAADGVHSLTAVARDGAGRTTVSAAISVRVDNTPPLVAITAPAGGATVSGSISIAADASDNSGIAGVQFTIDGANAGTEDTTAPYSITWDTTAVSDGTHTVGAVARDASGRTTAAAAVSVRVSNVTETLTRLEETHASIAYTGSWSQGNTAKAWSGGTAALATSGPTATGVQTRATLTFTGSAVKWIGFRGPQTGIARVHLDGTLVATVDTYAGAEAVGAVLYEVSGLAAASHTLAIEVTGTRNPASSDIFVVVDAFDVTTSNAPPPPPPDDDPPSPGASTATRYEDTDATIVYTPGSAAVSPPNWWHGSRSRGWSGETSSFNRSEGARATFTFTGTSVTWIGFRANWAGIARVYVDGTFVEELDLYSVTEQPQARVFTAPGLAAGTHTIAVEATGRKNASATDNAVVVDAFEVSPASAPRVAGTRIEENAAAVTATGSWIAASAAQPWSGGSASMSSAPGARTTVTFTGNTVSLIGLRSPQTGIARVYLDGSFHSTVDTFASSEVQAVIFTETNLAQGTHELAIEVTGLKHAAATDHRIVVDAFDVRTLVEEVDPAVTYSGTWTANFDENWSGTSPNYGSGSAARSLTAGSRAELRFVGTGARWIGYRGPAAGIARVYIDGVLTGEVDAYAPVKQVQAELFSTSGLAAGPHTMTIEVTGLKNAAAGNAIIVVDAFDVTLPPAMPAVSRLQQGDATYPTGPWEQSTPNPLFTGTTIAHSSTAGARAEFTFTGTGVRWIGQRGFANGMARIYLDGVHVADVDSHAPMQEEYQAVQYSVSGLAAGAHTLTIEVLGTRNPASSGTRIVVDGFDVIR